MTLDATVNTDFAQVEVDEFQINLDRFNLFYPEKRPFFLENAGLFAVGSPAEVELFFSRRIGIGDDGEVIPIVAGARVSGQVHGINVGLLNMQTDSFGSQAASNFTVARVRKDLPNRSNIGAIVVNREGTGSLSGPRDYNRSFAVDGRAGIGRYAFVSGFAARTVTPDSGDDAGAFEVRAERDSPAWLLTSMFTSVGRDFNPEVGFLSRDGGFRKGEALIFYRYRPADFLGLQEIRPHTSYRGYWDRDGFQTDRLRAFRLALGVEERVRSAHRLQSHARGRDQAVRDLSRHLRAPGHLRREGSADRPLHAARQGGEPADDDAGRRVLRRRSRGT